MIPVPNFKLALQAYQRMSAAKCRPWGIFVHAGDDNDTVGRYMKGRGMEDVDLLIRDQAGIECAMIATDVPTQTWLVYARAQNHLWWQWFGASVLCEQGSHEPGGAVDTASGKVATLERALLSYPAANGSWLNDGNTIPIGRFSPSLCSEWYQMGTYEIARYFRIGVRDIPCLKVRPSFHNERGEQFFLGHVSLDQISAHLRDIVTDGRFQRIVANSRS